VSLLPVAEWLASTNGSIALHESLYMYPLVESTHVLALCLFLGMAIMLDLRLLGLALRRVPMTEIQRRLGPWMVAGFVVMVVTGVLLFYAIPVRSYQSIFFRIKVVALILAGLNAFVFHSTVDKRIAEWDLAPVTPAAARRAGAVSLVLWAIIVVSGRMIAYNWFDCDKQPQAAIVNTLAGCVVPAGGRR
jgi:ABC-type transport system involved in cytochrome c biogenesis permease subunit